MQGKVMAVCTSPEKGTGKTPRDSVRLLPDPGTAFGSCRITALRGTPMRGSGTGR